MSSAAVTAPVDVPAAENGGVQAVLPGVSGRAAVAVPVQGSLADGGRAAAAVVWRELAAGLAGTPRVRLGRWISSRQGLRLVYDKSRELAAGLPTVPAALRVYDDQGLAQALGLDFDPSLVGGDAAVVEREAAAAAQLLREAGARVIVDVSPSGGRHVWAPLAAPAGHGELLPIGRALQALYRSLDVSPLRSVATGCLTAPGSLAKRGRYRELVTPLAEAVDAVQRRSAPELVARLRERLAPVEPPEPAAPAAAAVVVETERAVSQPGGPRPLDAVVRGIAERGIWPATRRTAAGKLWTGSEARQSVLASCAARGWALSDVRTRLQSGQWPGLAGLYAKYGRHGDAQLRRDWAVAVDYARRRPAPSTVSIQDSPGGGTAVSQGHTSGFGSTHGGASQPLSETELRRREHRHLRRMYAILDRAAELEHWGHDEISRTRWAVLRALIVMGMRSGSRTIAVGSRSLSFGTGLLDHGTVARVLRVLRDDADGWIDRVTVGRGRDADRYELRIPDRYAHLLGECETLPSGRLTDVHPIYAELGLAAWRVLETIEAGARSMAAVAEASGVSRGHVYKLLKKLQAVRLVAPAAAGGWRRTRRTLSAAAKELSVPERVAARRERYRAERGQWRAWLERRGRQDWAELTWMASVDGPLWWPDLAQLQPPPNDPDPPSEREAVRLLTNVFDAVVMPA